MANVIGNPYNKSYLGYYPKIQCKPNNHTVSTEKESEQSNDNGLDLINTDQVSLDKIDTITISAQAQATLGREKAKESQDQDTYDDVIEVTECKTTVTFNAAKRARQLAAAKNADEIRIVLSLLGEDLSDCESGLKTGGCDEEEVEKVKRMIARAKEKLSQVSHRPGKEDENTFDAFDIASLM